jgi:hypothetical protein
MMQGKGRRKRTKLDSFITFLSGKIPETKTDMAVTLKQKERQRSHI